MPDLQALFVDMDGTLVDTADANFAAYAAALDEAGVAVDRAEFDRLATGRQWRQFLPPLLTGTGIEPAAVAARKQSIYPGMVAHTRLNRHLMTLISALRPALKLGLVTSASRSGVSAILAVHGLESWFDIVISGDDVTEPKPSPEAYLLAARGLDIPAGRCMVIEDSPVGVESARRAGMTVLKIEAARFSD